MNHDDFEYTRKSALVIWTLSDDRSDNVRRVIKEMRDHVLSGCDRDDCPDLRRNLPLEVNPQHDLSARAQLYRDGFNNSCHPVRPAKE